MECGSVDNGVVAGRDFIDPEPLLRAVLEERLREFAEQYPEPRSSADDDRIKAERRRLIRELGRAKRTAKWLAPPEES